MIYKKGRKSECKGVLTNYFKHLKILSNWLMINESGAEISAQPAEGVEEGFPLSRSFAGKIILLAVEWNFSLGLRYLSLGISVWGWNICVWELPSGPEKSWGEGSGVR